MSVEKHISHQNLEKTFVDAIKKITPSPKVIIQPRSSRMYRPDIVLEIGNRRVFIEIKSSRYPAEVIKSIYQIVGYSTLASEDFDLLYIVIPNEALSSSSIRKLLSVARRKSREKIGAITFIVEGDTITYEVVETNIGLLPTRFSTDFSMPRVHYRSKVSLSSPKALRVVRQLLLKNETTQLAISRQTRVSLGHVNKIVSYFRDQRIVSYRKRNLSLAEPWKLLNEISWARSMHTLKSEDLFTFGQEDVENVEMLLRNICVNNKIPYAFALFSAAKRYSSYSKKYDAVQLYVDNYDRFRQFFSKNDFKKKGQGIHVEIFQPDSGDILRESKKFRGFNVTSEIQTVIDLVCYGTIGKELAVEIYSKIRSKQF